MLGAMAMPHRDGDFNSRAAPRLQAYAPPRPSATRLPSISTLVDRPSSSLGPPKPPETAYLEGYQQLNYQQHHHNHHATSPSYQHAASYPTSPDVYYASSDIQRRPVAGYVGGSPTLSSTASERSAEDDNIARAYRRSNFHGQAPPPTGRASADQQRDAPLSGKGKVAIPHTPHNLKGPIGRPRTDSASKRRPSDLSPPPRARPETEQTHASNFAVGSRTSGVVNPVLHDKHTIHIRQQPVSARSCGYGERDRRTIDPPPILQLSIDNPDLTPEELSSHLRYSHYVVHCTIWTADGSEECSVIPDDGRRQRRLMGSVAASPFAGRDEHGKEGCFFTFSDLSVRTPGKFRLKFAFIALDVFNDKMGKSFPVRCTAMSDVFSVYPPKDFPGMVASTPLAHALKEQGCLIAIKKGRERAGGGGSGSFRAEDAMESSGDETLDEGKKPGKRKRARRG